MRSLALIFLPRGLLEAAKFLKRIEVAEGELQELALALACFATAEGDGKLADRAGGRWVTALMRISSRISKSLESSASASG